MCDIISRRFEINGAIAITTNNINDIFNDMLQQPGGAIQQILDGQKQILGATNSVRSAAQQDEDTATVTQPTIERQEYSGSGRVLTADFTECLHIFAGLQTLLSPSGICGFTAIHFSRLGHTKESALRQI